MCIACKKIVFFSLNDVQRYMEHPNQKVAQASHTLFSAFVSSDKESSDSERASIKEQLTFYYMERSLAVCSSIFLRIRKLLLYRISGDNFSVF